MRQRIKFSICCDIYALGVFVYRLVTCQMPPSPFAVKSYSDLQQ